MSSSPVVPVVPTRTALDAILDGREYYLTLRVIAIDNRVTYLSTTGRSIARPCIRSLAGICRIASTISDITWRRVLSSRECELSDFFGVVTDLPAADNTRYFIAELARYSRRCTVEIELTPRAAERVNTGKYARINGKLERVKTDNTKSVSSPSKIRAYRSNFSKRWSRET